MVRYFNLAILSVVLLLAGCSTTLNEHSNELKASEGKILLQPKDLGNNNIVSLDGEWAFYWQQFLTTDEIEKVNQQRTPQYIPVPSNWQDLTNESYGFATYSLTVTIPDQLLGNVMGIYVPYQYSSYSLWVDGVRIASNGYVGTSKESSEPAFHKELVYFIPEEKEVQLTMHIANFKHPTGGANRQVFFGTAQAISDYYTDLVATTLFVGGGILMMGIYQISIYVFRRKERAFFYFGLLSIFVALRSLFIEPTFFAELLPSFPWIWQHRIEHLIMYGGFALYLLFLRNLYPKEMKMWVLVPPISIAGVLTILTYFSQPIVYKPMFDYFLFFAAVILIYTLFVLMKAVRKKRRTSVLNLSASIFFFLTIVYDGLISFDLIRGTYLATYGFFIYILIQSINLSRNVAQKFQESECLTAELTELNRTLDEKIDLRTKELQGINGKLRELTLLDGLTGVNNRRFFEKKMKEIVDQLKVTKEPMTLLLIDLDEFKKYNDSYGHVMGDELIKFAASMLKDVIGDQGYVSRYGGEEFVIIIPNCLEDRGRGLAEAICQRMQDAKMEHQSSSLLDIATLSIGGTSSSRHPHVEPRDWIELADKALYESKMNGKNQVTMF